MKSFAAVTLVVSAALVSASTIPTGISAGCSTFLTAFDQDSSFASYTSPLIAATAQFIANSTSPSSATVNAALNTLCAITPPTSAIRPKLADFYSACTTELSTNPIPDVVKLYDFLYVLIPFQQAVCSKTDSGDFCVGQISITVSPSDLYTSEGTGSQAVLTPNTDTIRNNNIPFLGYTASTPKAQLCTSCVRLALTSFVSWESSTPYGPGLAQSPILSSQPAFYTAVQNTCGASFMQGAVQAAGELSGGILSGAPRTVGAAAGGVSVLLGALTAAMVATL